jgi:hypothetical protein
VAITSTDIVKRLSTTSGSAGDSTAGTPAASLGKYASSTAITDATLNNLFDDVTGAEASAGDIEYRCFFVLNNHATLTLQNATIAVQSETAGGGSITIALDNIAVSAKGSASAQAATIANEDTAPTGVGTFGTGPLTIGDMAPGQVKGIWVKRTVASSTSALNPDGVVLRISGDTLP